MCWGDRCEGLFSSGLPSGNCLQKFSKKNFLSTAVSGIVHGGGPGVVHAPATLRAGTTRLARTQAQRYLQDSTTFSGGKGHHQRVPSTEAPSTHTCPRAALAPPRRRAVAPRWRPAAMQQRARDAPATRCAAPRRASPLGAPSTPGAASTSYHPGSHGDKHAHYYFLETLWLFFFLPSFF